MRSIVPDPKSDPGHLSCSVYQVCHISTKKRRHLLDIHSDMIKKCLS